MTTPPWEEYRDRPASRGPWEDYRPQRQQAPSSRGAFDGAVGARGTAGAGGGRGAAGSARTRRPGVEAAVPFVPAAAFVADPRRALEGPAGFMANVNRGVGVGDEIAAAMNSGVNLIRGRDASFNTSMAQQRQIEQSIDPRAAALGRGTGMAATALVPLGGAATQGGTMLGNALRGAVMGGTSASLYSAADAGTLQERLNSAASAATDPVVLGLGAATGGLLSPRSPRPPRPVDPNLRELRQRGVRVTPGQAMGGTARAAEDAATSVPILGDAIVARRTEGLHDFNRGILNDAHQAAFGRPLPANVQAGREGIAHVGDAISAGYRRTIPTGGVVADPQFADDLRALAPDIEILTPAAQAQLRNILDQRVTSRFRNMGNPSGRPLLTNGGASGGGPRMDGRTYQRVQSELGTLISRYSGSTDADQRAIGEALQTVQTALNAAARRQNPQFAAAMERLDSGWALISRAEDAASGQAAVEGIVTPSQYAGAVRRGDPRVRHRGYARGEALGQRYAEAGRAILPSSIPDSGTARRTMMGEMVSGGTSILGAAGGGTVGGAPGAAVGAVAAPVLRAVSLKLASLGYSRPVISLVNRALDARIATVERQVAMQQLQRMAQSDPQLQGQLARLTAQASGVLARPAPAQNNQ